MPNQMRKRTQLTKIKRLLEPNSKPLASAIVWSNGTVTYGGETFESLEAMKAKHPTANEPFIKFSTN
jgi:hypothetical protein